MTSQSHLDALRLADSLRERLVNYSAGAFFLRDERLQQAAEAVWRGPAEDGGLLADLWVEGAFEPAKSSVKLRDVSLDGSLPGRLVEHLALTGSWPEDRRLFQLQLEAWKATEDATSEDEPAVLVSAGTGAGKTEAFLFPVLSRLFSKHRRGPGVRCLILYPLNALIRDQLDRLDRWLQGQREVRTFAFNSETPEDPAAAARGGVDRTGPHFIRTRQEARSDPPDICITNYSMLEYMLARPQDAPFFGAGLEAVVIDEAHLYRGALAAEVALLLRRVLVRAGVAAESVLFIGTSATLGGTPEQRRRFFGALTGKDPKRTQLVEAELSPLKPEPVTSTAISPEEILARWATGGAPSVDELLAWKSFQAVRKTLWDARRTPVRLKDLARGTFSNESSEAQAATTSLLHWGSTIRPPEEEAPLLPHRLHLPLRGSAGLGLCISPDCVGPADVRVTPYGSLQAQSGDACSWCGSLTYPVARCIECGSGYLLATLSREGTLVAVNLPPATMPLKGKLPTGAGSTMCLQLWPSEGGQTVDAKDGSLLDSVEGPAFRILGFDEEAACPRCQSLTRGERHGELRSLVDVAGLTLTLIAETVLGHTGPADAEAERMQLPAEGRRLLIFSDSRRESARLGPVLTWQHEIQLARAAILDVLENEIAISPAVEQALQRDYELKLEELNTASDPGVRALREEQKQSLEAQLARARVGGSLRDWASKLKGKSAIGELLDWNAAEKHEASKWNRESFETNRRHIEEQLPMLIGREFIAPGRTLPNLETLGLLSVVYPGLDSLSPPDGLSSVLELRVVHELAGVWPDVLAAILDSLRRAGAVTMGSEDDDEAYSVQRAPIGKFSIERGQADRRTEPFIGATTRQQRRRFAALLLAEAGVPSIRAADLAVPFLDHVFHQLLANAKGRGGRGWDWLETERHATTDGNASDGIRIRLTGLAMRRAEASWRDDETGQVVSSAPLSLHPATGGSRLTRIDATELDADPRFARRRSELRGSQALRMGLWAEEHSAQLSAQETRRLQDLFELGVRNVLSSSTTMELGVDIGGLEAVMMSNVPPNNARYQQRAGRAGRRARGSAIAVTYTRNQPFDREVFSAFDKYLNRPLPPPSVILHRERIGERHLNAHLLGHFMRLALPARRAKGAMHAFGRMGQFDRQPSIQRWTGSAAPRPDYRQPDSHQVGQVDTDPLLWWDAPADKPLSERFIDYLDWLASQPGDPVRQQLATVAYGTGVAEKIEDWSAFCDAVRDRFTAAVRAWRLEYEYYLKAWERAQTQREANFIRYQANHLYETTVIEQLANERFLPRYGFPIGLLALRVQSNDGRDFRTEDRFELQRSGGLALREYVPGSRVIVGGREAHSRGLLKHWTGVQLDTAIGERRTLQTCTNGHQFSSPVPSAGPRCPFCDAIAGTSPEELLMVRFGFSTAAWEPMARARSSEAIGDSDLLPQLIEEHQVQAPSTHAREDFARIVGATAELSEGGRLIATNRGEFAAGFAVCLKCGFADSEVGERGSGALSLPPGFEMHSPLNSPRGNQRCSKAGDLQTARHQSLAAQELTDTLTVDLSSAAPQLSTNRSALLAIGLAARHAGSQLLLVDAREIAVILQPTGAKFWRLLFYDDVSGGAGHVGELLEFDRKWFESTLERLYVNEDHHARCRVGCLDCIVSYEGQYQLSDGIDRRAAHDALAALLEEKSTVGASAGDFPQGSPAPLTTRAAAERVQNARLRRSRRPPHIVFGR